MPFMITWPFAEGPAAEGVWDVVPEAWTRAKPAVTPKRGCATEMLDAPRSSRTAIPCRTRHAVTKGDMRLSVRFPSCRWSFPAMTATAWRGPDGPEAGEQRLPKPTSTRRSARSGSAHCRQRHTPAGDMPLHGLYIRYQRLCHSAPAPFLSHPQ